MDKICRNFSKEPYVIILAGNSRQMDMNIEGYKEFFPEPEYGIEMLVKSQVTRKGIIT